MADYYALLGIDKSASAPDIRQAYLRLAKERHPDRFTDPAEKIRAEAFFKDLTTAFNTLFNEGSRREYDREREAPRPTSPDELAKDAYTRGLALAEQGGDAEEILRLLRAAAHHRPDEGRYHAALGRFLGKRTTFAREAIQSLERAVQLEPRNAAFHADLALLFHKQGLTLRAQKAVETAARLAPADPQVRKVLGLVGGGAAR
jgi:curved DNA-binding protein CbpA